MTPDQIASLDPVLTQATNSPSPAEEKALEEMGQKDIKQRLSMGVSAGPTTRQRTQSEILDLMLIRWKQHEPFSVRYIPFEQLREMTTDLMLAFGWYFTMAPLIRADWSIESPDAQLAAAVDEAFRPISSATYLNYSNAMWYGHQPLIKRFKLGRLGSFYRDPHAEDPDKDIPVWTSSADALLWKSPLAVNPSHCLPMWDENGSMVGFKFSNLPIPNYDLISAASAYGYEVIPGHVIDSDYAMWVTNEKELNFGSVFGSPRTKRAYRYWWSYWYRWTLADRMFESKVDPPKVVYFPTDFDEFIDSSSEDDRISKARETAMRLGESARSGATLALPADFVEGPDGKLMPGARKWAIEYLHSAGDHFADLDTSFAHLDTLKLRCVTADTIVMSTQTDGDKRISDLEPGDLVWTFNTRLQQFQPMPVKIALCTQHNQQIFKVTLSTDDVIRATANHPFLLSNMIWKNLDELMIGDELHSIFEWEYPVTITSITIDAVEDVWDVAIDDETGDCANFIASGSRVVLHNSWMIPEQAFIEGRGSSSSRNVAQQLGEVYQESQQLTIDDYDSYTSEHMIPQFIAANFPDKVGTPCRRVSRGLGVLDAQLRQVVLTLIGQVRGDVLPVDVRTLLAQAGIPLLNEDQMKAEIKNIADLAAISQPALGPPTAQGTQGYNAGVEQTPLGHRYVQPPQRILLAESDGFMAELPDTPHYKGASSRSAIVRLRRLFLERYKDQYDSFASFIEGLPALHLADSQTQQNENGPVQSASPRGAKQAADSIIALWASQKAAGVVGAPAQAVGEAGSTAEKMGTLIGRLAFLGGESSLKGARLGADDFSADVLTPWVHQRVGTSLSSIDNTVSSELHDWLENQLQKNSDPHVVADAAREHFADFPATHADRVTRTEARDAFNHGSLSALNLAGVTQVQAHDASDGEDAHTDAECLARDGRIFSIQDAMKINEHPNGTLFFTPLSTDNLTLERVAELPEHLATHDRMVAYDPGSETLYLSDSVDEEHERLYLKMLGQQLSYR